MKTSAVILTGGRSRRFGGIHKPGTELAGVPVISRILAAVRGADRSASVWVVGSPKGLTPAEQATVGLTVETPPYGGPLAGVAAAVRELGSAGGSGVDADGPGTVAAAAASAGARGLDSAREAGGEASPHIVFVLAGDMPLVTAGHLRSLAEASAAAYAPASGRDARGHLQYLCAAWPAQLLRRRLAEIGKPANRPVRLLYEGIETTHVEVDPGLMTDFDTPEDFERVSAEFAGRRARRPSTGTHRTPTDARRPVPAELLRIGERAAACSAFTEGGEAIDGAAIEEILTFASRIKHSGSGLSPVLAAYLAGCLHVTADGRSPRPASASLAEVEAALSREPDQ